MTAAADSDGDPPLARVARIGVVTVGALTLLAALMVGVADIAHHFLHEMDTVHDSRHPLSPESLEQLRVVLDSE